MLDLAFVRNNLPLVESKLRLRGGDPAALLGDFDTIDRQRREAITRVETLAAERNRLSSGIQALRKSGEDATALTEQVRALKAEGEALENAAAEAEERLRGLMQTLPNLPQDSVPEGHSEHDNVVVKTVGEPTRFEFPAKPHWEIGEALGILDFERAAKISGSRISCWTCTRGGTDIPRCCRRRW
jgi:seryl-tRNA synthetase